MYCSAAAVVPPCAFPPRYRLHCGFSACLPPVQTYPHMWFDARLLLQNRAERLRDVVRYNGRFCALTARWWRHRFSLSQTAVLWASVHTGERMTRKRRDCGRRAVLYCRLCGDYAAGSSRLCYLCRASSDQYGLSADRLFAGIRRMALISALSHCICLQAFGHER
jgi:hypothetical protein